MVITYIFNTQVLERQLQTTNFMTDERNCISNIKMINALKGYNDRYKLITKEGNSCR